MFARKSANLAPAAKLDASLLVRPNGPRPAARPALPMAPAATPETIAVSVRIAPELHLRLRLLAALSHRSQRDIVRSAIKRFLNR